LHNFRVHEESNSTFENKLKTQTLLSYQRKSMKRKAENYDVPRSRQKTLVVNNLKVLGKLGSGTYGDVYAIKYETDMAIKVTKPRINRAEHFSETLDAAREMYGLQLAGLLKGVVTGNDQISFIMPLLGKCIGDVGVPLWTVPKAAASLRSIAEKLASSLGMHRDIKASNIVLPTEPGNLTLLDFSLATFAERCTDESVTTLQYRAPEVIMGFEYGRSADI
jgi:serine/threonine protein kinase